MIEKEDNMDDSNDSDPHNKNEKRRLKIKA